MIRTRHRKRGAALLEFAMGLPIALFVFVGIGDFAAYFWHQVRMEEAARATVARITPNLEGYAVAPSDALAGFAQTLQIAVRQETGLDRFSVNLSRHYACPTSTGAEHLLSPEPQLCSGERVYLRIATDQAVEPLLGPLRWMGFPKAAFSRHMIRIR